MSLSFFTPYTVSTFFSHYFSILTVCFSLRPQYKQDQEMFKQTARLWSHVYAGAPVSSVDYTRKIDKLCAMGFDKVRITSCPCFEYDGYKTTCACMT